MGRGGGGGAAASPPSPPPGTSPKTRPGSQAGVRLHNCADPVQHCLHGTEFRAKSAWGKF